VDEWSLANGDNGRTAGYLGAVYPLNHPTGFNGGSYYVRLSSSF
jgi:iron complex outermembrane receptor protein